MLKEELEHACVVFLFGCFFFLVVTDLCRYKKLFKALNFHAMGRFFFFTILDLGQEVSYTLVTLVCFWKQERKVRLQFSVPFLTTLSSSSWFLLALLNNKSPCCHSGRTEWRYEAFMSDSDFCAKK